MKKSKFLALTMLCSAFCGMPAKACELKASDPQKIGGVDNSSNNEGDKNLKEKNRTKNKVSRFVDLAIDHPIWSLMIGCGLIAAEEGVRRKFFVKEVWGVNKFGYNEVEDCIYRNPNGKINVVILGSKNYRKKLISDLKKDKGWEEEFVKSFLKGSSEKKELKLDLTRERAKFDNWNVIERECNFGREPSKQFVNKLHRELKDDVTALIVVYVDYDKSRDYVDKFVKNEFFKLTVNKIICGNNLNQVDQDANKINVCMCAVARILL